MRGVCVHANSFNEMERLVKKYNLDHCLTADIGAVNINGTYRVLFDNDKYYGIDLSGGKNVDIIMQDEFDTGCPDQYFDLVISGQCLEHCRNPLKLAGEMYRICKRGGKCILIAPFVFKEHKYPIDCWRFLPDGFKCLFENVGFKVLEVYLKNNDCVGVAEK